MSNSINDTLLNLIIHTSLFYLNCLYNLKQVLAVLTHDTEARNPRDDSQKYSNSTGNWFQFQSNWGKHRETVSDIFDVYIMLREVFARIILRLFRGHGVCFSGEPLRPNALYAHPGLGNVARCWAQRMPMPIGCQFRFFFFAPCCCMSYHVMSCDNIKHLFNICSLIYMMCATCHDFEAMAARVDANVLIRDFFSKHRWESQRVDPERANRWVR